jgi:hypothetical protein
MQTTSFVYGDEDAEDELWLRKLTLPEEYLIAHYPSARASYWRWFQSENVIDLVRVLRLRARQQSSSSLDHP